MRVSFDGGLLNERGVAVALFDYAFCARELLGVEPVILHDAGPRFCAARRRGVSDL